MVAFSLTTACLRPANVTVISSGVWPSALIIVMSGRSRTPECSSVGRRHCAWWRAARMWTPPMTSYTVALCAYGSPRYASCKKFCSTVPLALLATDRNVYPTMYQKVDPLDHIARPLLRWHWQEQVSGRTSQIFSFGEIFLEPFG